MVEMRKVTDLDLSGIPSDALNLLQPFMHRDPMSAESGLDLAERERLSRSVEQDERDAYLTPPGVVRQIMSSLGPGATDARTVLEPSCGTGSFLTEWVRCGNPDQLADRVQRCFGVEINPRAALITRTRLWLLAGGEVSWHLLESRIRCGDALDLLAEEPLDLFSFDSTENCDEWPTRFDLVIGNPPFGDGETSAKTSGREAMYLRFARLSVQKLSQAGTWAMLLPRSFLAATSSSDIRTQLTSGRRISDLFLFDENVFDAKVFTCVPVVTPGQSKSVRVHLSAGDEKVVEFDSGRPTWGHILGAASGVPLFVHRSGRTLGNVVDIWVPHRDWFYAVAEAVEEASDVSNGSLTVHGVGNLGLFRATDAPLTISKRRFVQPVIPTEMRPFDLRDDVCAIFLAPQSKLLKCHVDHEDAGVPLTPVMAVLAPRDKAWEVASFLQGPVANGILATDFAGAARGESAIRATSKALRELPFPDKDDELKAAAEAYKAIAHSQEPMGHDVLHRYAELCLLSMGAANSALAKWWTERASGILGVRHA